MSRVRLYVPRSFALIALVVGACQSAAPTTPKKITAAKTTAPASTAPTSKPTDGATGAATPAPTDAPTSSPASSPTATLTPSPVVSAKAATAATTTPAATKSAVATPAATGTKAPVTGAAAYTVTTVAGTGDSGDAVNGPGASATFSAPLGLALDASGNLYVADSGHDQIRKITFTGTTATVSTLAGSGSSGTADNADPSKATFTSPTALAVDASGNVYVSEFGNRIREIAVGGGVTTIAGSGTSHGDVDGPAATSMFNVPSGLALNGTKLYVADTYNQCIRVVDLTAATVSTVAGSGTQAYADGTGTAAAFAHPFGLAVDGSGNLDVEDSGNQRLRAIDATGVVTTLAGPTDTSPPIVAQGDVDGAAATARFYTLSASGPGLAFGGPDKALYLADTGNNRIRKILAGKVTTVAGSTGTGTDKAVFLDGTGDIARFNEPNGIVVAPDGTIYVSDSTNNRIRKIK